MGIWIISIIRVNIEGIDIYIHSSGQSLRESFGKMAGFIFVIRLRG